jgi:hypothetical protein
MKAQGENRGVALPILNFGTKWLTVGEGHAPGAFHQQKCHSTHCRGWAAVPMWMGLEEKNVWPLRGSEPRTVQPVASSYTAPLYVVG